MLPLFCYKMDQRRKGEKSLRGELLRVRLLCTKAPETLALGYISMRVEKHSPPALSLQSTPYQMLILLIQGEKKASSHLLLLCWGKHKPSLLPPLV